MTRRERGTIHQYPVHELYRDRLPRGARGNRVYIGAVEYAAGYRRGAWARTLY